MTKEVNIKVDNVGPNVVLQKKTIDGKKVIITAREAKKVK